MRRYGAIRPANGEVDRIAGYIQLMETLVARLRRIEVDFERCLARCGKARKVRARVCAKASRLDLIALRATRIKRFDAIQFDHRMIYGIDEIHLSALGKNRHFDILI
jgi:hypothetical protein